MSHPRIVGIGTANPPVRLTQEQSFQAAGYQGERIRKIFLNSDIDHRHFYLEGTLNRWETPDQLNQRYLRGTMKTGCHAILNCMDAAGTTVQDVDFLAVCTCTGYVCPDVGSRPAVFLAGGIGIAPFLSMLTYATEEKLRHHIVLFYANRHLENAAFTDALWKLETANPRFRFVSTLTREANNNGWKGKTGHISSETLLAHVRTLQVPIYYITGPPTMVASARQTLGEVGIDEDDIRTEEFAGY